MRRETIRAAFQSFGIRQAELARAAGLSEASISRQLSGGLTLSQRVQDEARELLTRRAAEVATAILDWVELRRPLGQDDSGVGFG